MRPTSSATAAMAVPGSEDAFHDRPVSTATFDTRRTTATPASPRALRSAPCPHCTRSIERDLHFCPHCGLKTGFTEVHPTFCLSCGTRMSDDDAFCATCGEPLKGGLDSPGLTVDTQPRGITPMVVSLQGPRLSLLADDGEIVREIP